MASRSVRALLVLCVTLAPVRVALASDPNPHDAAVAAFAEARTAIDAGDCGRAVPKLTESLALEPSIGARLSLADCIERDDPLAAWSHLREAALLAQTNHDDRLGDITARATTLAQKLPAVAFDIAPADAALEGLVVRVDGVAIARAQLRWRAYALSEGEHVVDVSALGRVPWTARVVTTPRVIVKVKPVLQVPEPPRAPLVAQAPREVRVYAAPDPGVGRRTAGIALGASGIGALALGATFGFLTLSKDADIERACGGDVSRCTATHANVDALRESASTMRALTSASLAVGGALVLGGGLLFFTAPRAAARTEASLPAVRVGLGRVALEGTW